MTYLSTEIDQLDWIDIRHRLTSEGYAVLPGLLLPAARQGLVRMMDPPCLLHRVTLESIGLGCGDIFQYNSSLPETLLQWKSALYRHLVPVANQWCATIDEGHRYPAELETFLRLCRRAGQMQSASNLTRLSEGDYLALHQRAQETHVFPFQVVAQLNGSDEDFTGGEFVLVEQRPRMQTRPFVLPLESGDACIICAAHRPITGRNGVHRVNMKHAISRIRSGVRIGLETTFHLVTDRALS